MKDEARFERRLLRRWFAQIRMPDGPMGCWLWAGACNGGGYGKFSVRLRTVYAHRWGFERFRGPIPDGLQLDHVVCDTPGCANPWHVEPATAGENSLRGSGTAAINARKTHCVHGHPFDEPNTHHRLGGGRSCRACTRGRATERRRR